ncbi:MAG: SBBP repeat-containing protein, partial [Gemmatimonadaceae bacterium]|nr:SBBP repeat-containing protein [Gloeobacterales cyanobacterium ES-bin-141]
KPFIYQQVGKIRQQVAGHYALLSKQEVGFVLGNYNRRKTLVIDPVLSYSTYLSGSNTEFGYGIAVDKQGHTYVTGEVLSSDFPTTFGTTQKQYSGSGDAFVTKLSSSGSSLVYSTYLGGSDRDFGFEISVNRAGQAYITGSTTSLDFPVSAGAAQPVFGGIQDAFVVKLSRSGRFLVYSTYLGGSSLDFGSEVVAGKAGNAYVVGYTQSADFPVTAGAFQATLGGGQDAFVTRLDQTGKPVYATYLGGSADEVGIGISVDTTGKAYATGSTTSQDFPVSAEGFQTTPGGGFDVFVTALAPEGDTSLYSTYLGGSNNDFGIGVAVDLAGNAYLTGSTASTDFPVSTGAVQTGYGGGNFDGFVARLNAQGTTLQYSTYLGGSDLDNSFGIAVGLAGDVYVTGQTFSTDFVTTSDALKTTLGSDGLDAFVTGFSPTGTLAYSSYLGGDGSDVGSAITMDEAANVYIAGYTESFDYPTTDGAFQRTLNGIQAAFVTKLTP